MLPFQFSQAPGVQYLKYLNYIFISCRRKCVSKSLEKWLSSNIWNHLGPKDTSEDCPLQQVKLFTLTIRRVRHEDAWPPHTVHLRFPCGTWRGKSPTRRHCCIFMFTGFFQRAPFPPTVPAPNAFKLLILSHRNIQSKKSILIVI